MKVTLKTAATILIIIFIYTAPLKTQLQGALRGENEELESNNSKTMKEIGGNIRVTILHVRKE